MKKGDGKMKNLNSKEIQGMVERLEDYFTGKIDRGEFAVVEREKYHYTLLIDGRFRFQVWMRNEPPMRWVSNHGESKMHLPMPDIGVRERLHERLKNDYVKFINDELVEVKQKEIDKLKKEITEIMEEHNG